MKRHHPILILCFLLAWLPPVVAQNDAGLRTGPTIEAYERMYFGLFPDIPTFDSARVSLDADSSLTVAIARKGFSDTTLRIPPATARALRTVLAKFEATTIDDIRHPLLRDGIMLPTTGWRNRDHATIVALADAPDQYYRIVGIVDSTAVLEPVPINRDTTWGNMSIDAVALNASARPAQRIAGLGELTMARRHRLTSLWPAALRGALVGTAIGFALFSYLATEEDIIENKNPVAHAAFATTVSVANASLLGLPAGMIFARGSTILSLPDSVARRRAMFMREMSVQRPPSPELRTTMSPATAEASGTLAAACFREAALLRTDIATPAVSGLHFGLDYGMHVFASWYEVYDTPIAVSMHLTQPLGQGATPSWLLRVGGGAGYPLHAYTDAALIRALSPNWWIHAGATFIHFWEESRGNGMPYVPLVDQQGALHHVFAGVGIGFRVGRRGAFDIAYSASVVRLGVWDNVEYHFGQSSYRFDLPEKTYIKRHVGVLRLTLSWRVAG
jgi:hypothetical protein